MERRAPPEAEEGVVCVDAQLGGQRADGDGGQATGCVSGHHPAHRMEDQRPEADDQRCRGKTRRRPPPWRGHGRLRARYRPAPVNCAGTSGSAPPAVPPRSDATSPLPRERWVWRRVCRCVRSGGGVAFVVGVGGVGAAGG